MAQADAENRKLCADGQPFKRPSGAEKRLVCRAALPNGGAGRGHMQDCGHAEKAAGRCRADRGLRAGGRRADTADHRDFDGGDGHAHANLRGGDGELPELRHGGRGERTGADGGRGSPGGARAGSQGAGARGAGILNKLII